MLKCGPGSVSSSCVLRTGHTRYPRRMAQKAEMDGVMTKHLSKEGVWAHRFIRLTCFNHQFLLQSDHVQLLICLPEMVLTHTITSTDVVGELPDVLSSLCFFRGALDLSSPALVKLSWKKSDRFEDNLAGVLEIESA